jgi:hypothetical protein
VGYGRSLHSGAGLSTPISMCALWHGVVHPYFHVCTLARGCPPLFPCVLSGTGCPPLFPCVLSGAGVSTPISMCAVLRGGVHPYFHVCKVPFSSFELEETFIQIFSCCYWNKSQVLLVVCALNDRTTPVHLLVESSENTFHFTGDSGIYFVFPVTTQRCAV